MKNVTVKTNVSGITLITLVVTIIVLIILVGITFSALLGDNGVLNLARGEADVAQKSMAKEKIKIEVAGSKKINGKYVAANIINNILAHIENSDVKGVQLPLIVTVDGYTFLIDNNGRVLDADFDYLVQFDGNGVEGIMNSQEFNKDETKKLFANKYNQDGHIFLGWSTKPGKSEVEYKDEALVSHLTSDKYGVIILYAQWANGTAEVNGTIYDTLQLAIDAVPKNNVQTTVRLLTNTKENIKIVKDQNIILNLQNHTIRIRDYGSEAVVENSGTIEILNGKITSDSIKTATINNRTGGYLTINSVKVEMEIEKGKQAIYNESGATINIKGTAYLISASSTAAGNDLRSTITNLAGGILNITGGTIVSKNYHAIINNGTMTIGEKGGGVNTRTPIIQGAVYGVYSENNSKFKFYDGKIKGKTNAVRNLSLIEEIEPDVELITTSEGDYTTVYLSGGTDMVTVTFDPNGGEVDETTRNVEIGNTIGGLPIPTRDGYEFIGWFTESDVMINATDTVNTNVTYFAHWNPIYTVTFAKNANDAILSESETTRNVPNGQAVGTLPVPTRPKYNFAGWFTADSGGKQITEGTIISDDVSYYAHWNKIIVAQIGETSYTSLADAVSHIPDNTETTINVLTDSEEHITINKNKKVILNLTDCTINNTNSSDAIIDNFGTLTIVSDGSGAFSSNATSATINCKDGSNLTLDGVTVISTGTRSAVWNEGGTVTIKGNSYFSSTATGKPSGSSLARGTIHNSKANGTINIESATIIGVNQQAISNAGTLTLGKEDGNIDNSSITVISPTYGVVNTKNFYFYDGIIKGKTGALSGNITKREGNSQVVDDTEAEYKRKYLQF